MNENIKGRRHRGPSEKVNVYLGIEAYRQLHRCQGLLCDRDPAASLPSAGETVRVAIRRLLLVLLGERANLLDPADPVMREYLDLLNAYDVWPGILRQPRQEQSPSPAAPKRSAAVSPGLKGGLE